MAADIEPKLEDCTCLAIRQAARHVTQFYDQHLAPSGLRTTQFSILAKLKRRGPLTINVLARELVMDRTTLGRNILPLEREGLIEIATGRSDRRSRELRLTDSGVKRLRAAVNGWTTAQERFDAKFGIQHARELRAILGEVAAADLAAGGTS